MLNSELIINQVCQALAEDIGSGDLTAALVPKEAFLNAQVVTREAIVVCGTAWFETCFQQLCPSITIDWHITDGQAASAGENLCVVRGAARPLLTAERTALNFLQTLSAVATRTRQFVAAIQGTAACIVDTRKTIPGLRTAQKYAVRCGGGTNHRTGLYDGILIKENHIIAAGGIENILRKATEIAPANVWVQIEVETTNELQQALQAGAKMILLDNFSVSDLREAVKLNQQLPAHPAILEASGNITLDNVRLVAETGVDRISVGSLTKHIQAVDLSMRFETA
ncbi:carboxylating nicotinate-nucleotide diphosphorylase [Nitrosomonas mobilis]|uniref:Probable nicotinate-nucleotide pyrophosphorylase [carboxylating] n=1 Tax=Nitrosomonas mobilis TaxID=51642 RepID=A0A1G5SCX2_9PROT|nr:carboxylating nicotinate-nucleotide diphosphorylase [Nitrosomonas mobilis]SCZ84279.1 quinolinate phosphoribosyltransferase [Nitrosomonas mobilis]